MAVVRDYKVRQTLLVGEIPAVATLINEFKANWYVQNPTLSDHIVTITLARAHKQNRQGGGVYHLTYRVVVDDGVVPEPPAEEGTYFACGGGIVLHGGYIATGSAVTGGTTV